MPGTRDVDYALVGGGLQNGLIALALRACRPDARVVVIERGPTLGGNHFWGFHADDVPVEARAIVEPLVRYRWSGYRVRFPAFERRLDTPYAGIPSDHFDGTVRAILGEAAFLCGVEATDVRADRVDLSDGSTIRAQVVIDARGPAPPRTGAGFQKFLGLELRWPRPHGVTDPMLMDATVDQSEGFHFVYTLPLDEERLLVEDTYFSRSPALDRVRLRDGILRHVAAQGLGVPAVEREEEGVLPMPWSGAAVPRRAARGPLLAGYAGGWFHPATGYSFPVALRFALHVATAPPERLFDARFRGLVWRHRLQAGFCRLLNRMLFRWFAPEDRWHVFARFYGLSEATIARFYALQMTMADAVRLVVGRPPRGLSLRARLGEGRT